MENASSKAEVIAGHLLCCSDPLAVTTLEDIKASILLSQLKADSVHPSRLHSPVEWSSEYTNALATLGWIVKEYDGTTLRPDAEDTVELGSIVEQMLLPGLSVGQAEQVHQAMNCLSSKTKTAAHQLFDKYALSDRGKQPSGNFGQDAESGVALLISVLGPHAVLKTLWIAFKTSAELTQDIFRQPFTGTQIKEGLVVQVCRRSWNAASYGKLRGAVEEKLGGRKESMIMPLACPHSPLGPEPVDSSPASTEPDL